MRLLASLVVALAIALGSAGAAHATPFEVLVVMSYEEDNPWVREIRAGIDGALAGHARITYFHMNTKVDPKGGPKRGEEAAALFESLKPHGVITVDDDAQSMFAVPFLRDRTTVPVMFNGVNAQPSRYGFPNSHVSGVLERAHVRESLAFAKMLVPSVQTACFMTNDVPPGHALRAQVEGERHDYPLRAGAFHHVATTADLARVTRELQGGCDVLFVDSLEGIADDNGSPLNHAQVMKLLRARFKGPILAGNRYQVEQGAWAAVAKTGQEQGDTSARMLLEAMQGKPVNAIPVTRNVRGQRIINVSAMEASGIALRPLDIRGATLVRERP
jgi:ABC-type uncharacterized transport system substrate-binding protein